MKKLTTSILVVLVFAGCTSAPKKQIEREREAQIQMQEPADNPQQLIKRAALAFSNAPNLSAEQKARLNDIYVRVYLDALKIRRDMGKAKSLMFMTLAKMDYRSSEISDLKSRIVELDQKRLVLMFKALEDVQEIVGKGIEAEKIYKHFQDYEIPGSVRDYQIE